MPRQRMLAYVTLLACPLLWACGGASAGSGLGPCDEDPPAAECGKECAVDLDCTGGFYCGDDGTCTADCAQDDSGCEDGYECTGRGQCEVADDDDGCPDVSVNLAPVVPKVILLIDRSGSMLSSFGTFDTRWEAVSYALADPNDGVLGPLEDKVEFGASLYTSDDGNLGGTCPMLETLAPATGQADEIGSLVADNPPYDSELDTPTAEAVTSTAMTFPASENPRVIILATDGNPDSCVDPDDHGDGTRLASENAVKAAFDDRSIYTYVLSVGEGTVASDHLQNLANVGQGLAVDGSDGNADYYEANSPAALITAFDDIIRGIRSCEIEVDGTVDVSKADQGTVVLNGNVLEYGSDWTMLDENTIVLLGEEAGGACYEFLNTDNVSLSAEFPCGGVVVD